MLYISAPLGTWQQRTNVCRAMLTLCTTFRWDVDDEAAFRNDKIASYTASYIYGTARTMWFVGCEGSKTATWSILHTIGQWKHSEECHIACIDVRFADIFSESGVRTYTYAQVRSSGARWLGPLALLGGPSAPFFLFPWRSKLKHPLVAPKGQKSPSLTWLMTPSTRLLVLSWWPAHLVGVKDSGHV